MKKSAPVYITVIIATFAVALGFCAGIVVDRVYLNANFSKIMETNRKKWGRKGYEKNVELFKREYNLSEAQTARFEKIISEFEPDIKIIHSRFKKELTAEFERLDERLLAEMTPEQAKMFKEKKAQRDANPDDMPPPPPAE